MQIHHLSNQSLMVIDAKGLFDAAQRNGVTSFTDKRTGIEATLGDGVTKPSARQVLADRVHEGMLKSCS